MATATKTRKVTSTRMLKTLNRRELLNRLLMERDNVGEPADAPRDPRETERWLPAIDEEPKALNYYSTFRSTVMGKVPVPVGGPAEMTYDDIANVELVQADDYGARWTLGPVDPDAVGTAGACCVDFCDC